MRLKKILITWVQRIVCGWLIFCVGGLAPLTFSTPLSSHRDVHTVNIALFTSPRDFSVTRVSTDALAISLRPAWHTYEFTPNVKLHSFESFIPSLVQFFQSNLSSGYLLTAAPTNLISPSFLIGLIAFYILSAHSALLPPIEKPPKRFLV